MTSTGTVAPGFDVVARRSHRSAWELAPVLHVVRFGQGQLRFDRPLVPCAGAAARASDGAVAPVWRTTGRLYAHGRRLTRFTPVGIEVHQSARDGCELRVKPAGRRPRWSGRRRREYFVVAHRALSELIGALDAAVRRMEAAAPLALGR
jgi:hypothetical protein